MLCLRAGRAVLASTKRHQSVFSLSGNSCVNRFHVSFDNNFAKKFSWQIFTENLFYGTMEGLLHSIPTNSPEGSVLADWLDECVQCDKMENCTNRFDVANRLLQIFGELLLIGWLYWYHNRSTACDSYRKYYFTNFCFYQSKKEQNWAVIESTH